MRRTFPLPGTSRTAVLLSIAAALLLAPFAARADGEDGDLGPQTGRFIKELEALSLKPAQKEAIDPLAAAARQRHEEVRAARRALRAKIEEQVRAGSIDRGELAPLTAALVKAAQAARDGDAAALVAAHGVLDAAQRARLVKALQEKGKGDHGRLQERGRRLAQEVGFSPAQKQDLRGRLDASMETLEDPERHAFEARQEARQAALRRFAGKTFTEGDVPPAADVEARVERRLVFLETVVPLLTPEQREHAAEVLGGELGDR